MNTPIRVSIMLLTALILISCGRSEFTTPVDLATIESAIDNAGLQRCVEEALLWAETPGFVSGKFYELGLDCSAHDRNHPGARVWVAQFDSAEARDAAALRFETGRRHLGSDTAWTHGPYLVVLEGPQRDEVRARLMQAAANLANP